MEHFMKTVLVTGANRGIGLEFVKQYVASSFRVIACCRDPQSATSLMQLVEANPAKIILMQIDMSNFAEIEHLGKKLEDEAIDILINNAGLYGSENEFGAINSKEWLELLKVNTMGPVLLAQALEKSITQSNLKIIANM